MIPEYRQNLTMSPLRSSSTDIQFSIDSYESRSVKEESYRSKLSRSESMTLPFQQNHKNNLKTSESFSNNSKFSTLPTPPKSNLLINYNHNTISPPPVQEEDEEYEDVIIANHNNLKNNNRKIPFERPRIVPNEDLLLNQKRLNPTSRKSNSMGNLHAITPKLTPVKSNGSLYVEEGN